MISQRGPSATGTKPFHCFRVHHWMVNTVQRSPFFPNIILTVGEWNFAIWREEVMVTNSYHSTLLVTNRPARIEDDSAACLLFLCSTVRRVPSSCLQIPSKHTQQGAGHHPDLLFSSLERKTAASRCGTYWKRPTSPFMSRSTSATPGSPVWKPGLSHVSFQPAPGLARVRIS